MQIERIPEWNLSANDDAEIASLLARCFSTNFGGRSFFLQRHHLRLVVRDGPIVGHMALVLRAVELGSQMVSVAGLADVATDPGQRGKGIASGLLQAAIAEAKASPAAFLLLFGVAKLYPAAGFLKVANKVAHIATKGPRTARVISNGDNNLMMLELGKQRWLEGALLDLRGPVF